MFIKNGTIKAEYGNELINVVDTLLGANEGVLSFNNNVSFNFKSSELNLKTSGHNDKEAFNSINNREDLVVSLSNSFNIDFQFNEDKSNPFSSSFNHQTRSLTKETDDQFSIMNFCFFVKKSENKRVVAKKEHVESKMIEEDSEDEIKIMGNEENKIKPVKQSDLMTNLDSLNISADLKKRFIKSIKSSTKKDIEKVEKESKPEKPSYFVTACKTLEDKLSSKMKNTDLYGNLSGMDYEKKKRKKRK